MIKALVIDDEENARDYLQVLIKKFLPRVTEVYSTADLQAAAKYISVHKPSLVFLDVEMKGMNGFEFLQSLEERNFEVIFTTAFSKYAIQAIRFSAIDFLLKPVQPEELIASFNRFLAEPAESSRRLKQYSFLFQNLGATTEKEFKLTLRKGNRIHFISPNDICWCKGENNYTKLYTKEGAEFIASKTLKEFEEMLAPFNFLRVHKSALANSEFCERIENQDVILTNGMKVEISRRRMKDVIERLSKKF